MEAEIEAVKHQFGPFIFEHDGTQYTRATGHLASNSDTQYSILVELKDFPDQLPEVFVIDPVLRHVNGYPLSDMGGNQSFHLLRPSVLGHAHICHFPKRMWRPSITLRHVLMKIRLWIEAYEEHHRTGRPIDTFLAHVE